MTPDQYRTAIKALGLSQERAGEMLGIAPRTSQGYALGEYPVPAPIAKLLRAYERIKYLEPRLSYFYDRIAGLEAEIEARRKLKGEWSKPPKKETSMTDDPSDDPPEEREITAPCPDCGGGGVILIGPIWIFQTSQTCPKCHGMGFIVKPVGDRA